jgi:methionine salvage enolase-phosphatase E1
MIKQHWTIEEISIFSNSNHLEWRAGLSDIIVKGTLPRTIPARFGLIWLSGFRGKDLNAIFYQNMPNLHNRYKSAERKMSQKNPQYMLNYSFPCGCSKNFSSFRFIIKQQCTIEEISIFSNSSHLELRAGLSYTVLKGTHPRTIPAMFGLIWFRGFRREDLNVKVYDVRRTDGRRTPSDGKSCQVI